MEEGWPQPDRDAGSLRLDGIFRILLEEGYSITYGTTSHFSYTQPLYQTQMRCLTGYAIILQCRQWRFRHSCGLQHKAILKGIPQDSRDHLLHHMRQSSKTLHNIAGLWVWKPGQKWTLNSGLLQFAEANQLTAGQQLHCSSAIHSRVIQELHTMVKRWQDPPRL